MEDSFSLPYVVCHTRDIASERGGGAGPVRSLLGGKDLTGRFL